MTKVTLKKGEGRTIKSGGFWIYDNEIDRVEGHYKNGDVVSVFDFDGYPMGRGCINAHSKIRVRMLSFKDEEINEAFWKERIMRAWDYRKKCVDTSSCRVIFGEADGFPGFIVDKYEDVLVVQSLSLGMDRHKDMIIALLREVLESDGVQIHGVYERSDAKEREKEGMEKFKGFIGDSFDTDVKIVENGVRYTVDVANGQKTGFFLDQKYNRLAMQRFCRDAKVLDCFCHTGSFGLNAAYGGAREVVSVDASDTALATAAENAKLNGFEKIIRYREGDAFEILADMKENNELFDVVILDPPAFTKARDSIKKAAKGYRNINTAGLKLTKDGGIFATCSCSHFMDDELFTKVIKEAAAASHKRLRLIERRHQSPDHPVWLGAENSYYLKFYIYQCLEEL